jgi:CheY-like chemotaxis protein
MSLQTIYLVEDNQDNSDLFCAFLADRFSVRCFSTGLELLDHLGAGVEELPDLFVLDIQSAKKLVNAGDSVALRWGENTEK